MSWQVLAEQEPGLAAFGAQRLGQGRVAYLATVDPGGAPRLHPVTPVVGPQHLYVFMEPTSPKGHDLARGSRYALHCAVEDSDGGSGEFRVQGWALRVTDPQVRAHAVELAPFEPADRYVLFELLVDDAFSTRYAVDGTPERQHWTAP